MKPFQRTGAGTGRAVRRECPRHSAVHRQTFNGSDTSLPVFADS